jgi:O-antigen/teichoic acid export membrane protein
MWECQLLASGRVVSGSVISLAIQVAIACGLLAAVSLGGGIVAMASVVFAGTVLGRFVLRGFLRRNAASCPAHFNDGFDIRIFRSLAAPAFKCWITNIGSILLFQVDNFFIAKYMGPGRVPDYRAAFQLLINVQMIAAALGSSSEVFVTRAWKSREHLEVSLLTIRNLYWAGLVMAAGYGFVLGCGKQLFELWLGPGHFIGTDVLLAISAALGSQAFVWILMSAVRATEYEVFAVWSLVGAGLNLLFTWLSISHFGYFGVSASTAMALLLSIGWYGVAVSALRLKISIRDLVLAFSLALIRLAFYFTVTLTVVTILKGQSISIVASATAIFLVAIVDVWLNLLRPVERSFIRRFIGSLA